MRDARRAMGFMVTAALMAAACWIGTAQAAEYPVIYDFPAGLAESVVHPTPPGANDWTCRPTAAHPSPVVLVPGLTGSAGRDWQATSPLLADNGYCVFAYDFSSNGEASIEDAAAGRNAEVYGVTTSSLVDSMTV